MPAVKLTTATHVYAQPGVVLVNDDEAARLLSLNVAEPVKEEPEEKTEPVKEEPEEKTEPVKEEPEEKTEKKAKAKKEK